MKYDLLIGGLLLVAGLAAQPRADWSLSLGNSTYLGDLTSDDFLPNLDFTHPAAGLQLGLPIGYNWRWRIGVQYAELSGDDAASKNPDFQARNIAFHTKLIEPNTTLLWEPFARRRYPKAGGYKGIVSPYLFAGIGVAFFDPATQFAPAQPAAYATRIQLDKTQASNVGLVLPVGGGLRFDMGKHLSLGLEASVRKTFTDYLDGVSHTGQPDTKDWYLFGGLTLSYRLHVPDYDRDGFLDTDDKCPQAAGVDYTGGCPDADADGLPDAEDLCPYQIGKADAQGCPDRDYDRVPDFTDHCPDYPGMASAKGCLDSDGDELADDDDMCPYCPGGPNSLSGCPDADADGIEDARDRCPNLPGISEGRGCPFIDTDIDGIPDDTDDCPQVAGIAAFQGCPDTDADGLPDTDDKCPTLPGTLASKGCPEVSENLKALLASITQGVQFETGSDRLQATSMAVMDTLVAVLAQHPHYHLYIAGHTDDQGKATSNLRLSKARAMACRNYLISKDIAPAIMHYDGFGHTRPIALNTTPAGRKQNRRVTFELRVE